MDKLIRSLILRHYNHARPAARSGAIDEGRLNRALGIALRNDPQKYGETTRMCLCPDAKAPGHFCKHRLRMILMQRVYLDMQIYWLTGSVPSFDPERYK